MIKTITMKTAITTIATLLLMTTTAVAEGSCTVKTDTSGNQIKQGKCDLLKGVTGSTGPRGVQGIQGKQGSPGKDGTNGTNGIDGVHGLDGSTGATGPRGLDGQAGVTPLGSLSFTAAVSAFYGDGIGFGLSYSNSGNLEGSVVIGLDLTSDWRLVGGITSDFNKKTAVSVGLGFSF